MLNQTKIFNNVSSPTTSEEYLCNSYAGVRLGVVGTGTYKAVLYVSFGPEDSQWTKISGIELQKFTVAEDMHLFDTYDFDLTGFYKFKIDLESISGGSINMFASLHM